jgi:hypothetical protein
LSSAGSSLPSTQGSLLAASREAFRLFHLNVENPSLMIVIMALPLVGLGLFYIFPFQKALPIYLCFLFISGLMYYGMFTVMGRKRKVRTGFEEMIGEKALVLEDINPAKR